MLWHMFIYQNDILTQVSLFIDIFIGYRNLRVTKSQNWPNTIWCHLCSLALSNSPSNTLIDSFSNIISVLFYVKLYNFIFPQKNIFKKRLVGVLPYQTNVKITCYILEYWLHKVLKYYYENLRNIILSAWLPIIIF